jgi:hypothetical protein
MAVYVLIMLPTHVHLDKLIVQMIINVKVACSVPKAKEIVDKLFHLAALHSQALMRSLTIAFKSVTILTTLKVLQQVKCAVTVEEEITH